VYTKTAGGYEKSDWADRVFQKNESYDGQKEFRFSITGSTGDRGEDHVILKLGSCRDIVRIALIMNPEQEPASDSMKAGPSSSA
jgi:hypothetical protein